VTESTTTPVNPPRNTLWTATATCPAGTTRTGGGEALTGSSAIPLVATFFESRPEGANAWQVSAWNQFQGNALAYTVTAFAVCVGS
jgi:hypothetical protein